METVESSLIDSAPAARFRGKKQRLYIPERAMFSKKFLHLSIITSLKSAILQNLYLKCCKENTSSSPVWKVIHLIAIC